MQRTHSRLVSSRSSTRRRTAWARLFTSNLTLATLTAAGPLDLLSAFEVAGASTLGSTIVRCHLRLTCASPTTDTNPGLIFGVIRDTAPPTGANVINPSTQTELDWSWWDQLSPGTSESSLISGTTMLYGRAIDIKGKRKFTQLNDRWFFTIFNNGSATLTYGLTVSTLLALP